MAFQKATKKQAKGRMAIDGPSGSGKTFTALRVAKRLAPNGRIAVIDTERGSASKYADLFDFDVDEIVEDFHPKHYIEKIKDADKAGYEVIVIDSLSHAWEGAGGVLELTDKAASRMQTKNSYTAWRETTPIHNSLVNAILQANAHVIVTMRSKTEYVLEEVNGKKVPSKKGMAPIQRAGMEYEFDVVVDMNHDHEGIIAKTRCNALKGQVFREPGENDLGRIFAEWLNSGDEATLSPSDLNRVRQAITDRVFAEGGTAEDIPAIGKAIVESMGFASSKEVPSNRLGELLELVAKWTPGKEAA